MSYPPKAKLADLLVGLNINEQLELFEVKNKLILPEDLIAYFKLSESQIDSYNVDMFTFFKFDEFKSVEEEVGDYGGVPDYTNIVNTLPSYENCFVFAEYSIYVMVFAIRLYVSSSTHNEVYAICGDKYKLVAKSFDEFISIYNKDFSDVLM